MGNRPGWLAGLGVSVAANLVLVAALLRGPGPATEDLPPTPAPPPEPREKVVPSPALTPEPQRAAPFHWSQLESTNYPQYVANLRQMGCPEDVIGDIIRADLNDQYREKMAAIWQPSGTEYWQKPRREQPDKEEAARLQALTEEKRQVLTELLGSPQGEQSWVDLVLFQLHGPERELLFLPEETQAAAMQALAKAGFERKEEQLGEAANRSTAQAELFREKLAILAKVLSPQELEEYRLRYSPAADAVRMEVQYFDCTPEEFRALVESREKDGGRYANLLDRRAAEREAIELFGEERGREFGRVSDLFYINARRAAEEHGLPPEAATRVWEAVRLARADLERVVSDPTFSAATKRQLAGSIRSQVEARIVKAMGEAAATGVLRDVQAVLAGMERSAQP